MAVPDFERTTMETEDLQLLRLPDVCALVGLRRSSIYKLAAEGKFPKPVKLSTRASAWRRADIARWIEARAAESCGGVK